MNKGTKTREMIIARSAQLFSRKGFFGTSFADIMEETELKKGGIYGHFQNKDELALEAFDYAFGLVSIKLQTALEGKKSSVEQLKGLVRGFTELAADPPLVGGCPVLNTAVEADDTHPALRKRARQALDMWFGIIRNIVVEGVENEEIKADTDPEAVATLIIASYEGAAMLGKLYRSTAYIKRISEHLIQYIEGISN